MKQMGGEGSVYVLATWRAAPGHGADLNKALTARAVNPKVQTGDMTLAHIEDGP